ncbi:hypothetical protein AGR2A_pa60030 [Agrobacterium genomosp. 2 str. CFBP 5494]|uniref:Uncharacterized protein n=1 Tax=Agrobacterium genomosp. 2 str. CFBP 5494 TaxID=1183436 RepID=A0A9W5B7A0_9HYPH|nr:hypothetical protein AGR2A_pa60030 [Agrobacterium genomosp. 2 str. CFBP 5494]
MNERLRMKPNRKRRLVPADLSRLGPSTFNVPPEGGVALPVIAINRSRRSVRCYEHHI